MKKRGYTHVKELVPVIQQMVAEGKTQREIAEYYGFRDKEVVKEALKHERRKEAARIPKQRGRNCIVINLSCVGKEHNQRG